MTDETQLMSMLEMLTQQFQGLTYEKSSNGKLIQVHYEKIDAPVRSYHPDGNLRFSKKNDGSWEMAGDAFACHEEYKRVTDAAKMGYLVAGATTWSNMQGMSIEEEEEEKTKNQRVLLARLW